MTICRAPVPACRCRAGRRWPAACSETCTSPEQSSPSEVLPPHRYGAWRNSSAMATKSGCRRLDRRQMHGRQMPAIGGDGETLVLLRDDKPRAHRQRHRRRQLDVRPRKAERARHRNLVGRRPAGLTERVRRQPADIAVGLQLAPGPAFVGRLVDDDALAHERLGHEPRLVRRRVEQVGDRLDHFVARAFDEARGLDLASQIVRRDLGAERIDARIERNHSVNRSSPRKRGPRAARSSSQVRTGFPLARERTEKLATRLHQPYRAQSSA